MERGSKIITSSEAIVKLPHLNNTIASGSKHRDEKHCQYLEQKEDHLKEQKIKTKNVSNANNVNETSILNDSDSDAAQPILLFDQDESFPDGGLRAWLVVLSSFLGLISVFGYINATGAIQSYIETYKLTSYTTSQISWIFSIYNFMLCGGGIVAGPIFDMYGFKALYIIGTLFHVGGIMMTSLCTKYYQFILATGICCGIGSSLLMTPLVGIVNHWFLKKRGNVNGLATAGGSAGGVAFPLMLRSLYPEIGFAWSTRILGFICLTLLCCCVLLSKERLPRQSKKPLKKIVKDLFDFSALKEPRYMLTVVANLLGELATFAVTTYISLYGLSIGMTSSESLLLASVVNATGIFGRIFPGMVSDKVGRFNTMICSEIVVILLIFIIWFPFGHIKSVLYTFAALYGFACGSIYSLMGVCVSQICRTEDFGKRYGTMYFFISLAMLGGLPAFGAIIGKNKHYSRLVLVDGVILTFSALFWILARGKCVGFGVRKVF